MKEGWEYKKLGDITEIKGGKRLPKGVKLLTTPTEHPYIRVADFNDFGTVDTDDIHYISDSVYEQIKRYIIKKEDVYISIAGTIGKSGIIPDYLDGANLTENACRLILSSNVCQRYVYYFTISPSFIKQIDERTKKSAQPKLALTRLSDVIITYPTIKEQQSIVDYLDSAFAKIDAMKANAEKSLNEAKALFQASLKEMLEPKEGWEEKTIEYFAKIIHGKNQKEVLDDNGLYPIYGSGGNIMGYANSYLCDEGTTILGRKGTIDNPLFIEEKFWNVDTAFGIIAKDNCNKKYLYYSILKVDWAKRNTGTTLPSLTQNVVYNVEMCAPSLKEQQSIVATLDSLKSKVDRLQDNYEKISQECDALKQAILRQIFE